MVRENNNDVYFLKKEYVLGGVVFSHTFPHKSLNEESQRSNIL
jgi:hypothetical protein